ncbi:MAG: hypothetical protein R3322_00105 [Kiloniellales bacterium]|nr:hypothetical protein [Kiloniellales bacterium]
MIIAKEGGLPPKIPEKHPGRAFIARWGYGDAELRVWENIEKQDDRGCWRWCGGARRNIVCLVRRRRWREQVPRLLWYLMLGEPVREGYFLVAQCDTPGCVQPAHHKEVEQGSQLTMGAKKRGQAKTSRRRRTEAKVINAVRKLGPCTRGEVIRAIKGTNYVYGVAGALIRDGILEEDGDKRLTLAAEEEPQPTQVVEGPAPEAAKAPGEAPAEYVMEWRQMPSPKPTLSPSEYAQAIVRFATSWASRMSVLTEEDAQRQEAMVAGGRLVREYLEAIGADEETQDSVSSFLSMAEACLAQRMDIAGLPQIFVDMTTSR